MTCHQCSAEHTDARHGPQSYSCSTQRASRSEAASARLAMRPRHREDGSVTARASRRALRTLHASLLGAWLSGCSGNQSMLAPQGHGASRAAQLWWLLFAVGCFVFLTVSVFLLLALWKRERATPRDGAELERKLQRGLIGGVAATVVLLLVIMVATLLNARQALPHGGDAAPLTIRVAGELYWWRVTYLDERGEPLFETANELHIPVDVPVKLLLESDNVIHSFWVPNLQGKTDMIPGRTNEQWLHAEQAGVFRGQCAEFCGIQHTKMAFFVIAEPPAVFERWLADQQQPPSEASAHRLPPAHAEAAR